MLESIAQANVVNDARKAAYDGGTIRYYTGTRPASVAAGVSGTLLGTMTFSGIAFTASSNRILTANTVTQDGSADNSGTIGYAACFASNGTTLISLHSVSTSGGGGEIIVNSLSVTAGLPISMSSFTITQPDGA